MGAGGFAFTGTLPAPISPRTKANHDPKEPRDAAPGEASQRRTDDCPAGRAKGAMDDANAAERSPLLAQWWRRMSTAGHAPRLEIPRVAFQGI